MQMHKINMAAVTVVIPLYNKQRQIKRAVCSVLRQTFEDWRLIVVDDGSTDNGPQIAREIEDSRIELIRQDNAGPGAARNLGIRMTHTPYIAFLDADDEWHPEFLETTLKAIQENDVAMVTTTTFELPKGYDTKENLKQNGIEPGVFGFRGTEDPQKAEAILSIMIAINNLIRTEIVRKYGGFYDKDRCIFGEDRTLLWRIAFSESFMIVGRTLAYYHTEDSELGPHVISRPLPPYLQDPKSLMDYCPQSVHTLICEVLDIQVLRRIQNQFRHSSRIKLFLLLHRHPGAKRYPKLYSECLKRLMPGFMMWQRIKKSILSLTSRKGYNLI
jgi:glycosyltransferase involved in cell wall biosynthesis